MSGLGVGGGQGWAREVALRGSATPALWGLPQERWLTQQLGQEAGLSAGATYIEEACKKQDGMFKSGNDEGTELLQHCPFPHCITSALQQKAGR